LIIGLEFPILNKFEKEKKVIELHKQGKTLKEIAKIVHMSFRDISRIIKAYERKKELQAKKEENKTSSQTKKLSKCSQAYQLFLDGNNPVKVAIDLSLNYIEVRKYWTEFLRLRNMKKLYNIFIDNEVHLDYLFKIYYFMLRNEIPLKDWENILRIVHDVINLNQTHSNLKAEIDKLKQTKNNYSLNQNITNYQQPVPLGPLPRYYNW
jgi:transposase